MKTSVHCFIIIGMALAWLQCGNKNNTHKNKVFAIDRHITIIDSLFKIREKDMTPNTKLTERLLQEYTRFADSFPNHDKAPHYLLAKSDLYYGLRQFKQQAQTLRDIIDKYPDFPKLDMCYYMLAHILDSEFDERTEAKKFYATLVDKFPRSVFTSDATARLETIDSLSFAQLIEKITHAGESTPTP